MDDKDIIFISHATPVDNTFAVWLATKLELCGYRVWVDINNLSPSVDFWKTIEETIRNKAAKFLFVASSSSVDPDRDGIKKELAVADKIRRNNPFFITPIRIDSVSYSDFPVEILRLNAIDFKNDWAKGLEREKAMAFRFKCFLFPVFSDIMALTKLNYNACIYGDGLPVTLRFSDTIGDILTAIPEVNWTVKPFKYYI